MTAAHPPSRFADLEVWMMKRKIRDEADARSCLEAAARSGLKLTAWARSMGVDGRSLRAWSINLARGAASKRSARTRNTLTKRVELIELVPTQPARCGARYVVRVGQHGLEVDESFDAATLRRLVTALASC